MSTEEIRALLVLIRSHESGGDYKALNFMWRKNPQNRFKYSASGAYQITKGTWGGYKGFEYAYQAPRHIQDERAFQIAKSNHDKGASTPVSLLISWYGGLGVALRPSVWHTVPRNHTLSYAQYAQKILKSGSFANAPAVKGLAPLSNVFDFRGIFVFAFLIACLILLRIIYK